MSWKLKAYFLNSTPEKCLACIYHYLLMLIFYVYIFCRGQQLAQQMQEQNPELVNQLRSQMGRPPTNSDDNQEQPPPGPGKYMETHYSVLHFIHFHCVISKQKKNVRRQYYNELRWGSDLVVLSITNKFSFLNRGKKSFVNLSIRIFWIAVEVKNTLMF